METHGQGMGRKMSDFNYWYDSKIVKTTKEIQHNLVDSLIGKECTKLSFVFDEVDVVILASKNESSFSIQMPCGLTIHTKCMICEFDFSTYRFEGMELPKLKDALKQITYFNDSSR
jgi:hypothetical protein